MKKRLDRLWKWIKTRWKWYVLGYYHCDECPYCWADYSYEGDCDCGCYIKEDIQDTCRLLPPFRFLIGWPRMRYIAHWQDKEYDPIGEFYMKRKEQEEEMMEVAKFLFEAEGMELCWRDRSGTLYQDCKMDAIEPCAMKMLAIRLFLSRVSGSSGGTWLRKPGTDLRLIQSPHICPKRGGRNNDYR